jgi:H+/gluconate symporter-like permease
MAMFGIFLSLTLLMWGAYRGYSVILLAPVLAALAAAFQADTHLTATYTEVFMKGVGGFVIAYFPIFLLGAIFGSFMTDSGAAASISKKITRVLGTRHALWAVIITCSLLTYGGVSAWVVVFTMYPLAKSLFKDANIPRRLLPATISTGAFSSAMVAFPGAMQIHNTMPMPYFGTTPYAAPVLGLLVGFAMIFFAWLWLDREVKKARARKEGYGKDVHVAAEDGVSGPKKLPPFWLAISPLILVLGLVYLYSEVWIPGWDLSYLQQATYGNKAPAQVIGIWSVIFSLLISVLYSAAALYKYLPRFSKTLNEGTTGSLLPMLSTASEVGYGATVAALSAFAALKAGLLTLFPSSPLLSATVSINLLAAITGSASGGLSIALAALGETYKKMALENGVSLETLHRVSTIACSGLDSLPHNGAIITLLTVCGLTHRDSYKDIFVTTVVIPLVITAVTLVFL